MTRVWDRTEDPLVTVIMPVRNESAYIERSLGSVIGQSYGLDRLQILVVDGDSSDDTRVRARAVARLEGATIEILDNPRRIAPCALNIGLRAARGDVVVRVDGHCEIGALYVSKAVDHLRGGEIAGVGGPLDTVGETHTARAIAAAMSSRFGVGGVAFRTAGPKAPDRDVDTVAFPAYPRQVMVDAGGFDEELMRNQDDEFNYRLRRLGHRIRLTSGLEARYYSRGTFRSLARQYFQYGIYKIRVLQKHPRQMSPRQFVPFAFVLALLAGLALWPTAGPAPLLALLAAYGAASATAALMLASRSGWSLLPKLPLAFALLHLGYGAGSLVGLVRFAARWGDRRGQLPRDLAGEDAATPGPEGQVGAP
ncbi:MAG: glycosyltransferase family 2 protein [Acidobacteriota bacterium]